MINNPPNKFKYIKYKLKYNKSTLKDILQLIFYYSSKSRVKHRELGSPNRIIILSHKVPVYYTRVPDRFTHLHSLILPEYVL